MADAYEREKFLVTIEALKSSMEDNADIQQAELGAIHEAAANTSKLGEAGKGDFVKNMAMTVLAIHIQRQELQEARESKVLDQESANENDRRDTEQAEIATKSFTYWEEMIARLTPVDKIGINLWSHMVTHLGNIQDDVFQIRNIMAGVSDVREDYERMVSRELAFKEVEDIGKMVDISAVLAGSGIEPKRASQVEYTSTAREREEEDKSEKHQNRLQKMVGSMTGYLKSMADKAKTAVKVGLVGILTALGLLWFIRFMQTDTWKNLTKIMADFINTGLPILSSTLNLLADGIIGTVKTLASWWDATFGRFFNWLGEQFGITREVTVKQPVMDKDTGKQKVINGVPQFEEVTKQVGFLGDGIGLLGGVIAAIAAPFVVLKGAMWALAHPVKLVTGAFKLLTLPFKLLKPSFWKGLIGGMSSVGSKFKNIGNITAQAQSGVQQLPTQPSGGGFGRSALKNLSGLGRGIANLGRGIGRGLGKLLENTLKGLARGIAALGNTRVLKGAAAMGILGLAMIPFAKAVNMFSKANWRGLGIAITGMAALGAAVFALSKIAMGGQILIGAAAMGIMGLALIPLSMALEKFSKVRWSSIGKGIVAIAGFAAAVGVLGAAMMTGIGAIFFGAGVAAVLALSAALWAFGEGAESAADGLKKIEPKLKSMVKLPITKLKKVGEAMDAVSGGLYKFSARSLGSSFLNWLGRLFSGRGPIGQIKDLAQSAPGLTMFSTVLKQLSETIKQFANTTKVLDSDKVEDFIEAVKQLADKSIWQGIKGLFGIETPLERLKAQTELYKSMGALGDVGKSKLNLSEQLKLPEIKDAQIKMWTTLINKIKEYIKVVQGAARTGTIIPNLGAPSVRPKDGSQSVVPKTLVDPSKTPKTLVDPSKKSTGTPPTQSNVYPKLPPVVPGIRRPDSDFDQLKRDEGFRAAVYNDSVGVKTIGYGFNLERSGAQAALDEAGINKSVADLKSGRATLTEPEALKLMKTEYGKFEGVAQRYVDTGKPGTWEGLSRDRQRVLTNMAYNMGEGGLGQFVKTRKHIQDGDFTRAAEEMLSGADGGPSLWSTQVGDRATRLSARMASDTLPINKFPLTAGPIDIRTIFNPASFYGGTKFRPSFNLVSGKQTGAPEPSPTPSLTGTQVNAGTNELQIARDTTARGREQTQDQSQAGIFNSTQVDNSTQNQFIGTRNSAPEDHRMASLQKLAWT